MKSLLFLCLGFFILVSGGKSNNKSFKVNIKEGSYVLIKGTSNVNEFKCKKFLQPRSRNLTYYETNNKGWHVNDAKLSLESNLFDCGGRRINADFKQLVNASEFPFIFIKVLEIKALDSKLQALIEITIAGKSKSFPIEISLEEGKDTNYSSVLELNIEDFNLEAPTKMMGLIKVHEEISIHVDLNLELIK